MFWLKNNNQLCTLIKGLHYDIYNFHFILRKQELTVQWTALHETIFVSCKAKFSHEIQKIYQIHHLLSSHYPRVIKLAYELLAKSWQLYQGLLLHDINNIIKIKYSIYSIHSDR